MLGRARTRNSQHDPDLHRAFGASVGDSASSVVCPATTTNVRSARFASCPPSAERGATVASHVPGASPSSVKVPATGVGSTSTPYRRWNAWIGAGVPVRLESSRATATRTSASRSWRSTTTRTAPPDATATRWGSDVNATRFRTQAWPGAPTQTTDSFVVGSSVTRPPASAAIRVRTLSPSARGGPSHPGASASSLSDESTASTKAPASGAPRAASTISRIGRTSMATSRTIRSSASGAISPKRWSDAQSSTFTWIV